MLLHHYANIESVLVYPIRSI